MLLVKIIVLKKNRSTRNHVINKMKKSPEIIITAKTLNTKNTFKNIKKMDLIIEESIFDNKSRSGEKYERNDNGCG
jgi:hypothetical protein